MNPGVNNNPHRLVNKLAYVSIGAVMGSICALLMVGTEVPAILLQAFIGFALVGGIVGGLIAGTGRYITGDVTAVIFGTICGLAGGMIAMGIVQLGNTIIGIPPTDSSVGAALSTGALWGLPVGIFLAFLAAARHR